MSSPKCLLVLGAGSDQLFMINTANEMGYETVAVDGNQEAPGLAHATYSAPIDFSNIKKVINFVEDLIGKGVNICGVSTMGSDIPHLVSEIADYFNWPGPSKKTGELATNKYLMKKHLENDDIPVPLYASVKNENDILANWESWGCKKLVIKPTDRAGSRGIRIIESKDEIIDAFNYAMSFSINGVILIEEFVEGLQISTETVVIENEAYTLGFADREYSQLECFYPLIIENGGWVPTKLNNSEIQGVIDLVEKCAKSLGIINGPAKGDVVICPKRGPMIIEMAARLSGGDFCESLVPLSSGVNYVPLVIQQAISDKIDYKYMKTFKNKVVANRYFFCPAGEIEDIKGIQKIKNMSEIHKFELNYAVGDVIPKLDSHASRVGCFIVSGDNREQVQRLVDYVYQTIEFKIGSKWQYGTMNSYHKAK